MSDTEGRGSVPTLTKAPASQSGPRNSAAKDPDDVPPGTQIGGHYQIERRLGGGAIGHVYEATNTWTTRRVAVKLLRRDFADDPEIAQRFLIEARAATAVAHPNIVDILDMGEDAQTRQLYIVQEFLEGHDLHEHLQQKGRLTMDEAAEVLLPVMQALATAHERGVLHRDLKPENIFLLNTPEGGYFPKVIDFGLARTETTAVNRVTRIGAVMGTPFYMSPEQARGDTNTDARADVWAMGVIWYECLTGVLPFEGDNLQSVLHQIFVVDPERLERRAPQVPAAVADAIHRAITRDLAVRYGSMIEFLETLDAALPPPPPQAQSSLRSSRPGRGSQPATRSMRPTPTPAGGMPRGKLVVGPPRRPGDSRSPEPEINPAFEATLHATPSPVIPSKAPSSGAVGHYELGAPVPTVPQHVATRPPPAHGSTAAPHAVAASPANVSTVPAAPTPTSSLDGLRIRALQLTLGIAVLALLAVSGVALYAMRYDNSHGSISLPVQNPQRPARTPPRSRPLALHDAATADVAPGDAATDAAPAMSDDVAGEGDDATATSDDADDRHSRHHRRRHDDEDGGSSHRSHHRHHDDG